MAGVMERTVAAIVAMSEGERAVLYDLLKARGIVLGATATEVAEEEAKEKPKGRRGGGKRSFWLRKIEGFDESAKKGFRLQGDWVKTAKDVPAGTHLALGWTDADEKKHYAVLIVRMGTEVGYHFDTIGGAKVIEGAKLASGPHTYWDDFEAAAKKLAGLT